MSEVDILRDMRDVLIQIEHLHSKALIHSEYVLFAATQAAAELCRACKFGCSTHARTAALCTSSKLRVVADLACVVQLEASKPGLLCAALQAQPAHRAQGGRLWGCATARTMRHAEARPEQHAVRPLLVALHRGTGQQLAHPATASLSKDCVSRLGASM